MENITLFALFISFVLVGFFAFLQAMKSAGSGIVEDLTDIINNADEIKKKILVL